MNTCGFLDGKKEFEAGCGDHFEPDGIYDASTNALVKDWEADTNPLPTGCFAKNLLREDDLNWQTASSTAGAACTQHTDETACTGDAAGCFWQGSASDNAHTAGGLVWGRRLTSFERSCHVGKF